MEKLKVVHSRPIWLKLTETWLHTQVIYLDARIEAHVLCERVQNWDQFQVKHLHQLPRPSFFENCAARLLNKLRIYTPARPFLTALRNIQPAILHSHFGHVGWREMPAAKKAHVKHIVTFYGYDVNQVPCSNPIWKDRYRELFRHIELALCEGPFMAQALIDLGCPPNKVKVHHLGIPVHELAFEPRVWERAQPLRILLAASFREKKGIPYALAALGTIQARVPLDITIIGDADGEASSQAEKQTILQTIRNYDLGARTHLLGYQPHDVLLQAAYAHHIFLSPSVTASDGDTEGGAPITLLEMAATGMPIVSTRHCDIPAVIQDDETGFLAEERDIPGLVRKLSWLIENRDRWRPFLEKSRTHIEQEYHAKIQGFELATIYTEVSQAGLPLTDCPTR